MPLSGASKSPGLHVLQAFVDFDSGAEAERAITTKDRQVFAQKFGDRYVRLVQARPSWCNAVSCTLHLLGVHQVSPQCCSAQIK